MAGLAAALLIAGCGPPLSGQAPERPVPAAVTPATLAGAAAAEPPLYLDRPSPLRERQWGISNQRPDLFDPPDERLLDALGVSKVRIVIPWDVVIRGNDDPTDDASYAGLPAYPDPERLQRMRAFYDRALAKGYEILVSFEHSTDPSPARVLWDYSPTPAEYRRAIAAFLREFPAVRWIAAWNEPNERNQPTGAARCRESGRPVAECALRAGAYWRALADECERAGCNALAGDFADNADFTAEYISAYREGMRQPERAAAWGWHAYTAGSPPHDPTRLQLFARLTGTPGHPDPPIWVTEAGGRVSKYLADGQSGEEAERSADADLRYLLYELPRVEPRLSRLYVYQWRKTNPADTFDAGLLNPSTGPRSLYYTFLGRLLNP